MGLPEIRAFLGIGSNLGHRLGALQGAIDELDGSAGVRLARVSPVYETDPVGGPQAQDSYLNAVVMVSTSLGPRQLLGLCHQLEASAGRVRAERWGPRTLDVDVLVIPELRFDEPDLTIPHPRMWQRRFVLAPLRDLAPDLVSEDDLARSEGQVALRADLRIVLPPPRRSP